MYSKRCGENIAMHKYLLVGRVPTNFAIYFVNIYNYFYNEEKLLV